MPVPICSDPSKPLVRSMDLASQLIAPTMRSAKHEVFDMPTNGSDEAVPVAPRCSRCAQPMCLARRTPRFGGLSDLYTFECRSCEISHTEESGPGRWRDTDLFRLFSKQARECRRLATLAQDSEDRSFWLRLSEHWLKLAQGAGQRTS
jgi:hypothetical protein